jgi:5-methylcytosine-specific restriction protein B
MATKEIRSALLLRTCLEILRDRGARVPKREVHIEVPRRVELTDAEQAPGRDGVPRWVTYLGYHTSAAASVGFVVKMDAHWSITEAGLAALELHPSADALLAHTWRRYREILTGRQKSHQRLEVSLATVADVLDRVPRGAWTSFEDLAALAGATVDEVTDLLVSGEPLPTAHRALTLEGELPLPTMVHPSHRGEDLRARLIAEGVDFYGMRANPDQYVPAEILRDAFVDRPAGRRAWLVRPSMVDDDPVARWLDEGVVWMPAALLPPAEADGSAAALRHAAADAYQHLSYAVRERLISELDAFLRRMKGGDLVLVTVGRPNGTDRTASGQVHLGVVDGPAEFVESEYGRSTLRRRVRWLSRNRPFGPADLLAPLPALMRATGDVVDLTGGLASVEVLLDQVGGGTDHTGTRPADAVQAVLPAPTAEFAREMLLDLGWLSGVVDLLRQRHQIVLFGPPGSGKTYTAMRLAERLTDPPAAVLVQMHPGYTYADFVEGFRPETTEDGPERLRLRAGPLRRLADEAREHPARPYLLIVDEINRCDFASVLGEAYVLLEYRDQPASLPNSPGTLFSLPPNLYLIGTMNTDDNAAEPFDAGLRRRFAFVEMHPAHPPVAGLLRRWLGRHGIESTAADLHDRLNELLAPAGHAIGPSYLMREQTYAQPDGLDLVWRHDILPLLAEWHRDDGVDVVERYGLPALRASLAARPAPS